MKKTTTLIKAVSTAAALMAATAMCVTIVPSGTVRAEEAPATTEQLNMEPEQAAEEEGYKIPLAEGQTEILPGESSEAVAAAQQVLADFGFIYGRRHRR